MAQSHVESLEEARNQLVEARRNVAAELTKPYRREVTPGVRKTFIELQETIEAIGRALAEEQRNA